jgi:hypothetical protein
MFQLFDIVCGNIRYEDVETTRKRDVVLKAYVLPSVPHMVLSSGELELSEYSAPLVERKSQPFRLEIYGAV